METYQSYKGYGITYYSLSGTTVVDEFGVELKRFRYIGEMKGEELAKEYIDSFT